tara:strand:- start:249 stop:515 length:267 start_codon:yes stop_codon:yes gene_type:complete
MKTDYDSIYNNVYNIGSGNHKDTEYGGVYKEDGYFICQMPIEYAEYIHWCDGCRRVREGIEKKEHNEFFEKVFETVHKYGITVWRYNK